MKPMKAFCLVISVFLVSSFFSGTAIANPTIDCTTPLAVVCDVSDRKGIQRVVVQVETGLGKFDVVDARFPTCQISATVSWDPIVPNYDITVTTCDIIGLKNPDGRFEQIHAFTAEKVAVGKAPVVTALPRESLKPRRELLKILETMPPVYGIAVDDGGSDPTAVIAHCSYATTFCGQAGEPCLVESVTEQQSCEGTTENSAVGAVCSASC